MFCKSISIKNILGRGLKTTLSENRAHKYYRYILQFEYFITKFWKSVENFSNNLKSFSLFYKIFFPFINYAMFCICELPLFQDFLLGKIYKKNFLNKVQYWLRNKFCWKLFSYLLECWKTFLKIVLLQSLKLELNQPMISNFVVSIIMKLIRKVVMERSLKDYWFLRALSNISRLIRILSESTLITTNPVTKFN